MAIKNLELRKKYMAEYYAEHREEIIARTRAYGKTHPRKRRKSPKNRFWCRIEDKPLWKKTLRKWLYFVHDSPEYRIEAARRTREWKKNNPEKIEASKEAFKNNPIAIAKAKERWARVCASPKRQAWLKEYFDRPDIKEKRKFAKRKENGGMDRYYSDVQVRLTSLLKGRLYRLVSQKNFRVSYSMLELLGCSIAEFRQQLESDFEPGMSWSNYGKGKDQRRWQIDHTIACRRFTLKKLEHQRVCFHRSNLRPLWGDINCRKDSRRVPKLTDAEVHAMHEKIYGNDIVPIDFPVTTAGITQPNKAQFSPERAQLGNT